MSSKKMNNRSCMGDVTHPGDHQSKVLWICVSFFCIAVIKFPLRHNLKERGATVTHSSRGHSPSWQGWCGGRSLGWPIALLWLSRSRKTTGNWAMLANLKVCLQWCTSSSKALPSQGSIAFLNHSTSWRPSVQTREPMHDIPHPNHSTGLSEPPNLKISLFFCHRIKFDEF